jgi:hypothetical protein
MEESYEEPYKLYEIITKDLNGKSQRHHLIARNKKEARKKYERRTDRKKF